MYTVYDAIYLGVQGETMSREVEIDVSELTTAFPAATIKLYLQRPVDSVPYPAAHTSVSNGVMTYIPDDIDTGAAGKVLMQISAVDTTDAVLKSVIAHGKVEESLSGNVSPDPPDAVQSWIDELEADKAWADKLENVAASATTLQPGSSATVAVTQTSDTTTFTFGIPKGQDGGGLASVNGKTTPNVILYGTDIEIASGDNTTLDEAIADRVQEPANEGTSGQVLATDGSGGRYWTSTSGAVSSVNGQTGAVVLDSEDVGAAAATHTHAQSDITGLSTDLAAKEDAGYITVGGSQYQIRIDTEGAAGYLTLVLES